MASRKTPPREERRGDGIYTREIEERESLIESCPIQVFTSSALDRWAYPNKLMPYYRARPGVSDSADMVIIDSGWGRVGSLHGILEGAAKTGADVIIPPDVTPACDGYEDVTALDHAQEMAEHYWEFLNPTLGPSVDAEFWLPIHPPYDRYLSELSHWDPGHILGYEDDPHFDYPDEGEEWRWNARGARPTMTYDLVGAADGVAIGGLRALDIDAQVEALKTVRRAVGPDTHVHALAPGTDPRVLKALRDHPGLIDSLDVSTPEQAPAKGKLPDRTWTHHDHLFPSGDNSSTVRSLAALYIAHQLCYMLSPQSDIDVLEEAIEAVEEREEQSQLADF